MHWIGFDVGKAFHWVCVLDEDGEEVLSRRVEASEEDLEAVCLEIEALGEDRIVGIDLMGGSATLLEAILVERAEKLFHVPGIAVNRTRDAYPGESKSDARDARVNRRAVEASAGSPAGDPSQKRGAGRDAGARRPPQGPAPRPDSTRRTAQGGPAKRVPWPRGGARP